MDNFDHWEYHKANAKGFHDRAQKARHEAKDLKEKRDFVGALKAEFRWTEYRNSRDRHKELARKYRSML